MTCAIANIMFSVTSGGHSVCDVRRPTASVQDMRLSTLSTKVLLFDSCTKMSGALPLQAARTLARMLRRLFSESHLCPRHRQTPRRLDPKMKHPLSISAFLEAHERAPARNGSLRTVNRTWNGRLWCPLFHPVSTKHSSSLHLSTAYRTVALERLSLLSNVIVFGCLQ